MSWQQAREDTLDRDDYECQFCGMTNDEHEAEHDRGLNAHHILKDREGGRDHPENLITVCEDCHNTLEQTHARAIAELKREQESDDDALLKDLIRADEVRVGTHEQADEINKKLRAFIDEHPIFADEFQAVVEDPRQTPEGDWSVESYRLDEFEDIVRTSHHTKPINSEWAFVYAHAYKKALTSVASELTRVLQTSIPESENPIGVGEMREIIAEIPAGDRGAKNVSDVLDAAEQLGYTRDRAEYELEKLRQRGDIYEPDDGWVSLI